MEFKRLADVEALTEIPEGANAFVEVNGEIKRVPGEGLGGASGFKTAVIKSSVYDDALNFAVNPKISAEPTATYSCINMTFEEAYTTLASGEILKAVAMSVLEGPAIYDMMVTFAGTAIFGVPCIVFNGITTLFWTPDGISTEEPSSGK